MEDQEHKISSYIEQQEDMKSMVSSLRGCATTSWMNISELLLYFVVIKWVEGRPGSIWHCQLAERYWVLLFCFLPLILCKLASSRGPPSTLASPRFSRVLKSSRVLLYLNNALGAFFISLMKARTKPSGQMNQNVIISNPYTVL